MVFRHYVKKNVKHWEKTIWVKRGDYYYQIVDCGKYVGELETWIYRPNFGCYVCYSDSEIPPPFVAPESSV